MADVTVVTHLQVIPSNRQQASALAECHMTTLMEWWLANHPAVPDRWAILVHEEGAYAPGKAAAVKRLDLPSTGRQVPTTAVAITTSDHQQAASLRHCVLVGKGKSGGPVQDEQRDDDAT